MQSIKTFKSSLRRSATIWKEAAVYTILPWLHEAAMFVLDRKRSALHAAG
jgi:hypothetical protein